MSGPNDDVEGLLKGTSEEAAETRNRLVRTWTDFTKTSDDIYELGFPMFTELFKRVPETKNLFNFNTTDEEKRHKRLKGHIKLLFDYINYAVEHIDELDDLTDTIIDLGTRHYHYGVDPKNYLEFGKCLLHAIKLAIGDDKFTQADYDAWMTFYYWIGGCIVKGINSEKIRQK